MKHASRARHSLGGPVEEIGLDRIRPPRPSSPEQKCSVKDCSLMSLQRLVRFGRRAMPTNLCWYHVRELERLMKAQGKDWGGDGGRVGEARFFYASKRGFHSY